MKSLKIFNLLVLLSLLCFGICTVGGKKYRRCELAKELLEKYKINKTYLPNWICLVEHESNSDTQKVTQMPNGNNKFGLFQISSKKYCLLDRKGGFCNQKCSDFLDDNIFDDVQCAKNIVNMEGFKHWPGWYSSCRNRDKKNLPQLDVLCPNLY